MLEKNTTHLGSEKALQFANDLDLIVIPSIESYLTELQAILSDNPQLLSHDWVEQYEQGGYEVLFARLAEIARLSNSKLARIIPIHGSEEQIALSNIFQSLGTTISSFTHNLANNELAIIYVILMNLLGDAIYRTKSKDKAPLVLENFPSFLDQTIAHLKYVSHFIKRRLGLEPEQSSSPIYCEDTVLTTMSARWMFDGIPSPGNRVDLDETQPRACVQSRAINTPIIMLREVLMEILYMPISNATKTLRNLAEEYLAAGWSVEDLLLEVNCREVDYIGQRLVAIEVFNSGQLIDLEALCRKIVSDHEFCGIDEPKIRRVVEAIKKGSRQASIEASLNPYDVLFLSKFSMKGSSGMGLALLDEEIDFQGGCVMINNVRYGEAIDRGVCVTIVLPQDSNNLDLSDLRNLLMQLKKAMQSGEVVLKDSKKILAA